MKIDLELKRTIWQNPAPAARDTEHTTRQFTPLLDFSVAASHQFIRLFVFSGNKWVERVFSVVETQSFQLERRGDGAVIVRVPSSPVGKTKLPDAVFAFRAGDPQYDYWEQQLQLREMECR